MLVPFLREPSKKINMADAVLFVFNVTVCLGSPGERKKQPWVNTNDKHALRHFKLDVKRGTEKPSHHSGSLICWTSEVGKTLKKKMGGERALHNAGWWYGQACACFVSVHASTILYVFMGCIFSVLLLLEKKKKKFKLHVCVGVIVHFYMPLSFFLICHFNRHYDRCAPYKPRITRPLLSLNGGIYFSEGSSFEPYLSKSGGGGGRTPGMLLFCELLLLVWKQRASFPSRKWTALPPIMMHNWNTSIYSGGLQWGQPLRTSYYSLANVRESPPFNIIFWSFFLSLQTLNPRRPRPHLIPSPSSGCLSPAPSRLAADFRPVRVV